MYQGEVRNCPEIIPIFRLFLRQHRLMIRYIVRYASDHQGALSKKNPVDLWTIGKLFCDSS